MNSGDFDPPLLPLDQSRRQRLRAGLCSDGLSLLGDGRKLDNVGGRKAEAETCLDFRGERSRREEIATEIEELVMAIRSRKLVRRSGA